MTKLRYDKNYNEPNLIWRQKRKDGETSVCSKLRNFWFGLFRNSRFTKKSDYQTQQEIYLVLSIWQVDAFVSSAYEIWFFHNCQSFKSGLSIMCLGRMLLSAAHKFGSLTKSVRSSNYPARISSGLFRVNISAKQYQRNTCSHVLVPVCKISQRHVSYDNHRASIVVIGQK